MKIRWFNIGTAVILALAQSPLSARADTYPRQPGIKILQYTFDVTLGDASDELVVKDTIALEFLAAGVRGLDLDLCNLIKRPQPADRLNPCLAAAPRPPRGANPNAPAAEAPSSLGRGMTITGITGANGAALTFVHENDRLHVNFPAPSRVGEKLRLTISYHGVPATGLFIGNNRYNERVFFTDDWPNKARNWLATIDHISVKTPKTMIVTAPSKYHVISNGTLTEDTDLGAGLRRTVWTETQPIPSWQFSLGVAQMAVEHFGESHGVPFSAWVFPQNREAGFSAVDRNTKSIFDFYWEHIGPYPYEKLAHVEAAGGGGATELASTIFYFGGFGAASHEMAHHWFGNSVTESDWDDVWLSEGFATYFALLYTEFESGSDAFIAGVKRTRDTAMNYILAHPDDTVVHNNLANISNVFSNSAQIYQGGAMVLHMLRGVVGTENFWAGIRLYSRRFYNGSASSDDLRHAFEDACYDSGNCPKENQDLSWFFREWLNRGGILKLQGGWHYDSAARQLQITLDQMQTQGLFRMPVEISITGPVMKTVKITVDQQHNVLNVPLDAAPASVQLDPRLWLPMMQASFTAK
jgi:aminopeptidase N